MGCRQSVVRSLIAFHAGKSRRGRRHAAAADDDDDIDRHNDIFVVAGESEETDLGNNTLLAQHSDSFSGFPTFMSIKLRFRSSPERRHNKRGENLRPGVSTYVHNETQCSHKPNSDIC